MAELQKPDSRPSSNQVVSDRCDKFNTFVVSAFCVPMVIGFMYYFSITNVVGKVVTDNLVMKTVVQLIAFALASFGSRLFLMAIFPRKLVELVVSIITEPNDVHDHKEKMSKQKRSRQNQALKRFDEMAPWIVDIPITIMIILTMVAVYKSSLIQNVFSQMDYIYVAVATMLLVSYIWINWTVIRKNVYITIKERFVLTKH